MANGTLAGAVGSSCNHVRLGFREAWYTQCVVVCVVFLHTIAQCIVFSTCAWYGSKSAGAEMALERPIAAAVQWQFVGSGCSYNGSDGHVHCLLVAA